MIFIFYNIISLGPIQTGGAFFSRLVAALAYSYTEDAFSEQSNFL